MAPDVQAALKFAVECHYGQWRDGANPLPYVTHPIDVLRRLRDFADCEDPEMHCAALLHDVLEDTTATETDLREKFGVRVANVVADLTRPEPSASQISGLSGDKVFALRTTMMLEHLRAASREAQIIKLCDRSSNLEEAHRTRKPDKLRRYIGQSIAILEVIPRDVAPRVWDDIDRMTKIPVQEA